REHLLVGGPGALLDPIALERPRRRTAALVKRRDEAPALGHLGHHVGKLHRIHSPVWDEMPRTRGRSGPDSPAPRGRQRVCRPPRGGYRGGSIGRGLAWALRLTAIEMR